MPNYRINLQRHSNTVSHFQILVAPAQPSRKMRPRRIGVLPQQHIVIFARQKDEPAEVK